MTHHKELYHLNAVTRILIELFLGESHYRVMENRVDCVPLIDLVSQFVDVEVDGLLDLDMRVGCELEGR